MPQIQNWCRYKEKPPRNREFFSRHFVSKVTSKPVLGRHCDSGSTLFSQRAFYYEAVRFVSDI